MRYFWKLTFLCWCYKHQRNIIWYLNNNGISDNLRNLIKNIFDMTVQFRLLLKKFEENLCSGWISWQMFTAGSSAVVVSFILTSIGIFHQMDEIAFLQFSITDNFAVQNHHLNSVNHWKWFFFHFIFSMSLWLYSNGTLQLLYRRFIITLPLNDRISIWSVSYELYH